MRLNEISKGAATLSLDPDELRILAAACQVAADYVMDGGSPTVNPFEVLTGSVETVTGRRGRYVIGAVLDAYAALFEGAGMAAFIEGSCLGSKQMGKYTLSAIRREGTGWRFPFRETESEADDVR